MSIFVISYVFSLFSVGGGYAAYLYGHRTIKFRWSEYFLLLIVPITCSLSLTFIYGIKIIYLFFLSVVVGFTLEYLVGLAYHKTLNARLWVYKDRFNIHGHTSLLTLPIWGVAGIVFFILSKTVGL